MTVGKRASGRSGDVGFFVCNELLNVGRVLEELVGAEVSCKCQATVRWGVLLR